MIPVHSESTKKIHEFYIILHIIYFFIKKQYFSIFVHTAWFKI
nr:MAG TPA: hypothetical protein [Caudoviricetes sp.]